MSECTCWISVSDRLPAVVDSFADGVEFHGQVEAWYPYFHKHNCRVSSLWTAPGTEPRWMVQAGEGLSKAKEPPTHWRHLATDPNL